MQPWWCASVSLVAAAAGDDDNVNITDVNENDAKLFSSPRAPHQRKDESGLRGAGRAPASCAAAKWGGVRLAAVSWRPARAPSCPVGVPWPGYALGAEVRLP